MNIFARVFTIVLILCFGFACSSSLQQSRSSSSSNLFSSDIADAAVMGKWSRSCALCHVNGEAGAPLVGDTEDWANRFAQGEETILKHVLEGHNSMPPRGYCMSCEGKEFRAMIGFMAGTNQ